MQTKIERIMNGRDNPGAMTIPLAFAEALYRSGVNIRNFLFDRGVFKTLHAPCKVISVGAITIGGAGKTPFVKLIANRLKDKKPGILSRGYKGEFKTDIHVVSDGYTLGDAPPVSADEPYMLARSLKGIPVVCAPERIKGAKKIVELGAGVIILDDGFGSRAIARDLNILILDAKNPFGQAKRLFPRGVLREPKENIIRADLIVVATSDDISDEKFGEAKKAIKRYAKDHAPIISVAGTITGFTDIYGAPQAPPSGPVAAFCGVAGPERFYGSLEKLGHDVAGIISFPDHHRFNAADIAAVAEKAKASGARFIVTTEKDAVRLLNFSDAFNVPLLSATYETRLTRGEEILDRALAALF